MSGFSRITRMLVAAFCLISYSSSAQLPDGSIAPDFTAVDINGNEHTLSDYLNLGIPVILEFSATWCGPCWNYHQSGVVQDFYELYGPTGTGEAMVLFLEADDTTTLDELNGIGVNTTGNWVTGTNFPIIDNAGLISVDYQITYFPTIMKICPSGFVTEIGQPSTAEMYASITEPECLPAFLPNDPALISYNGVTGTCGDLDVVVSFMNFGTDLLTNVTFEVTGGLSPFTYNWVGSLETYQIEELTLGTIQMEAGGVLEVNIVSPDDDNSNNSLTAIIDGATESTTLLRVEVNTDDWGEETGWEILDENGTVVAAALTGSLASFTNYVEDVILPASGCYTFRLTDLYGDGLNGSQWGGIDGSASCISLHDLENMFSIIYENDGSNSFLVEQGLASADDTICQNDCIYGCTDLNACNYDPTADLDDGSCGYVFGCTDPNAQNYDPTASCDDGTCTSLYTCAEIGNVLWDGLESGVYPQEVSLFEFGVPVSEEAVFNVGATFFEPGLNVDLPIQTLTILGVSNEPQGLLFDWPTEALLPETQHCLALTGTPSLEGVFVVEFNCTIEVEVFGTVVSVPDVIFTHTIEITPNINGIFGCTYPDGLNYNVLATIDDGSCSFINPSDLCGVGTFWNPISEMCESISSCTGDLDGNGAVNSGDLLAFLAAFGTICE